MEFKLALKYSQGQFWISFFDMYLFIGGEGEHVPQLLGES